MRHRAGTRRRERLIATPLTAIPYRSDCSTSRNIFAGRPGPASVQQDDQAVPGGHAEFLQADRNLVFYRGLGAVQGAGYFLVAQALLDQGQHATLGGRQHDRRTASTLCGPEIGGLSRYGWVGGGRGSGNGWCDHGETGPMFRFIRVRRGRAWSTTAGRGPGA